MGTGGLLLRRVRALVVEEPTAFLWVIPRRLAGSGYPASRGQVEWLGRQGIDSVLSVTEDPLPASWLDRSMNYMHIAMQDHQPPEFQSLLSAAERVEDELNLGRALLVHCQAGRGRTMCVMGAYLIRSKGMRTDDALAFLRGVRPGAVERGQEGSLRDFASRIRPGS